MLASAPSTATANELNDYYTSLDASCNRDSDCAVTNAGNCCGYFPKCLSATAKANPDAVKEMCKRAKLVAICGFSQIQSCKCEEKKCKPVAEQEAPQ